MLSLATSPYAFLVLVFLFAYFFLYPLVEYFRDKNGESLGNPFDAIIANQSY